MRYMRDDPPQSECINCREESDARAVYCEHCGYFKHKGIPEPEIGMPLKNHEVLSDIDCHKIWYDKRFVPITTEQKPGGVLLVRLMYTEYWSSEWAEEVGPYHVAVECAMPFHAPSRTPKQMVKAVMEQFGDDFPDWKEHSIEVRAELLADIGLKATLWQDAGWDHYKMLKEANEQCDELQLIIGFRLDGPQNMIGSTGWDFMKGDITAGIDRHIKNQETQRP